MTYRKVGGLHFWRIGRLGGSFYLAARQPRIIDETGRAIDCMLASFALVLAVPFLI